MRNGATVCTAMPDVADVEHLRVARDLSGHEQVPVAEAHRERGLAQEARDRHAGVAAVLAWSSLPFAPAASCSADLRVDDRVPAEALAEVDARVLRVRAVETDRPRRDVLQAVVGGRRRLGLAAGRDDAVAVRVDEMLVRPRVVGQRALVELTQRHERGLRPRRSRSCNGRRRRSLNWYEGVSPAVIWNAAVARDRVVQPHVVERRLARRGLRAVCSDVV